MRRLLLSGAIVLAFVVGPFDGGLASSRTTQRDANVLLLGNAEISPMPDREAGAHSEAFPFAAPTSGVGRAIHVYIDPSNRARSVTAAMYTSVGGHPRALLSAGSLSHAASGRWNVIPMRAVRIHQNTRYWIALLGTGGALAYRDLQTATCRSDETVQTHLRKLPARWSSARTWGTCAVSAYVSGTRSQSGKQTPPHRTPTAAPPTSRPAGCFHNPGACGYPDPTQGNVGPSAGCASLPPARSMTISTAGRTIANLNIRGTIDIEAPNVTINNVCVADNGRAQAGSTAIQMGNESTNALIENSAIGGADTSSQSIEVAVANYGASNAILSHDFLYNCGECVHNGPWTIKDSFVISNGMQGTDDHYEDVYCNDTAINMIHDTLLNPEGQTATVFCDTGGGSGGACRNDVSIRDSLLAGGGYMLYVCGNASSAGTSTMNVTNNRFARCTSKPFNQTNDGGYDCQGSSNESLAAGADAHGYWPYGGHYGVEAGTYCASGTWSGNTWDDNGGGVRCSSGQ